MFLERVGEKQEPVLEANRPGIRDALHQEVPRILEWRQLRRIGAQGGDVARRRRIAAECGVGAHLVVLPAERGEGALLLREIRRGWARGLRFERAVHPLVRPILLRRGGADALMLDP